MLYENKVQVVLLKKMMDVFSKKDNENANRGFSLHQIALSTNKKSVFGPGKRLHLMEIGDIANL